MSNDEAIGLIPTVTRARKARGEGSSRNGDAWLHPEVDEEEQFDKRVRAIIQELAEEELPSVNNFYVDSETRQFNLNRYFNALFWNKPEYLFVGEAPGIHGCALTGIPFTSERVIHEGATNRHFRGTRFLVAGNEYERSAFYFWEMINQLPRPAVLWNIFPLHPYDIADDVMENRPPEKEEKDWGKKILNQVLELFSDVRVVSVGNHAKSACRQLKIDTFAHIIHPSHHPKEFREQFKTNILGQ